MQDEREVTMIHDSDNDDDLSIDDDAGTDSQGSDQDTGEPKKLTREVLLKAEDMQPGSERDSFRSEYGLPVVSLPQDVENVQVPAPGDEGYDLFLKKAERDQAEHMRIIRDHGDVAFAEYAGDLERTLNDLPKDARDPEIRQARERTILAISALGKIVKDAVESGNVPTEATPGQSETRSYPASFDPAFSIENNGGKFSSQIIGGRLVESGVDVNGLQGQRVHGFDETQKLLAAQAERREASKAAGASVTMSDELRTALDQLSAGPGELRLEAYAAVQDPSERLVLARAIHKLDARTRDKIWASLRAQATEA